MRARPEDIDESAVVAALRDGWDFEATVVEYATVGAGSYHWHVTDEAGARAFVTVDDLGQKTWFGDTTEVGFDGLRGAFDTAVALRAGGLPFVVAPIPTREGESLRRLDARRTIALFPRVDGEAGAFGWIDDDDGRRSVVSMLAALHQATVGSAVRSAGFELPGRDRLEGALRDLDVPWTGGPLAEPAREAIGNCATELSELLELADRLAADAKRRGRGWVVTHGEPHAGNVMRTSEGCVLVDWDTVAAAPPERDMWMLVAGGAEAADLYTRATGTRLDDAALDFFRLTWDLKDYAEYLNVLRGPHEENDDTVQQFRSLRNCRAVREEWAALLD